MQDLPLADEFRTFAQAPAGAVAAGLLVARAVEPASDPARVWEAIARHAAAVPAPRDATALVDYLHGAGFGGAEDYYRVENSLLGHVLATRRGIPISLALVVLGVAAELGLPGRGINFPRHFLVEVQDLLIDPFAMRALDPDDLRQGLAGTFTEPGQALVTATPIDIALRMLNNLYGLARQRDDVSSALDLTGYQLLLAADHLPLHLERLELWLAAGVPQMALLELDQAIELAAGTPLAERLAARRASLAAVPPRVH